MSSRLVAGLLAATAAAGLIAGALLDSGLPAPATQWAYIVIGLVLPALGWLLAVRRPHIRYVWLLLATAVCLGLSTFGVGLSKLDVAPVVVRVLVAVFAVYYGLLWIFVPLLFPEGRLPSRRWRPVAWIGGVAIAVHFTGNLLIGPISSATPGQLVLAGSADLVAALMSAVGQLVTWIVTFVVFCGLVIRWRRSGSGERGQYAWMVAGMTANLAGFLLLSFFLFGLAAPVAGAAGALAVLGSLPVAIAVAVVRHRLLDLRIGIRGSRLLVVFDVRPTVDEMLTSLGTALEETPEPVEQLGRLAAAVRDGLAVRWAAVTLADGTRVVAGREEGAAALTLPVRGGLGRIECGPRDGDRLTAADRRLLAALAVPAGLAIQSAGLAGRLVNAQEAERRRIERNIHDGVQQQLVALIAGLELARATGGGPDMLAELREQARQTLNDLRELAAGIHPSSLSQGGLVEAVEERCARLPVPTTVVASRELRAQRFPDEVEGAMYFTVSEAVANALKHAGATKIEVRLARADGRLRATVTDDGRGFDPSAVGRRGLATLADRLDALGGGLDLDSGHGEGTRMNAWVPVDA
ncbi:sensor histidine kinase [Nonomuraea sp. NPDC049129]|uniref:sensor histidine kinase n=1 Tax=Nonomuraea sp. NPDC049129 TaxID=3155272 RepID=UPI0033E7A46E